jgi:hypothetical protein
MICHQGVKKMCNVVINEPEKNAGFILYNYLLSKNNDFPFTISVLKDELRDQYNLDLSFQFLKKEIGPYIDYGILGKKANQYFRRIV